MVHITDYEQRRNDILAATIKSYIKNASPVSSEILCRDFDFELSPATIRNVLAKLEEKGYLSHPHTSAGRVPTDKGYRYYVDFLMEAEDLLSEERALIEQEYRRQIGELEELLERTSEILSEFTHCAGIVSFLGKQDKLFYRGTSYILEQPEFRDLQRIRLLVKVLEEKERILKIINCNLEEKLKVYIGQETDCSEIEGCSLIASTYDLNNHPYGRLAVLGPTRIDYNRLIPLVEYFSKELTRALSQI